MKHAVFSSVITTVAYSGKTRPQVTLLMWLKEHKGTGCILKVLAIDEKLGLLSTILHHVDELR